MRPADSCRTFAPWSTALSLSGLLLLGCVDHRSSASDPCPCATGNVCCASGVCAVDDNHCGQATLALASENVGTWTGYFENYNLASGSDALTISLSISEDAATASGTLVMGAGDPPAPPTDLATPWPPGSPAPSKSDPSLGGKIFDNGVIEGYTYEAHNLTWENLRLKFTVALADAWRPLCDLYASHPITAGGQTFVCPSSWGTDAAGNCTVGPSGATLSDADCLQLIAACLPGGRCSCNETSCDPAVGDLSIDVALHDDRGDGSAVGPIQANIRLMRGP